MQYFKIHYLKGGKNNYIVIMADNKIEAIQEFKSAPMGVFLSIEPISEPFDIKLEKLKKSLAKTFGKKNIPILSYIATLRQMAVMLDAGIPINTTLESVVKTCDDKRVKEIFENVYRDIESGANLSEALAKYEDEVGKLSIVMIELGEKIGLMSESISKLADILQEIYDNRMKLKKATRYPLLVIVAMIISFSIVIVLVVPQFMDIFSEYQTELPFPTRMLIWIEAAIKDFGLYVLVGAVVLSFVINKAYKKSRKFHLWMDKMFLKMYIVGTVIYLSMMGRFVYIFNKLTTSGIPIIESLKTAISVVDNSYLKERLQLIASSIEEGKSLTEGFKETGQFENIIVQMINAGESSGSLNSMLEKISTYYKNKFQNLVDNVSTMIEPLLIAGIAGFVLLLGLGIFLPMWSLANAVGG